MSPPCALIDLWSLHRLLIQSGCRLCITHSIILYGSKQQAEVIYKLMRCGSQWFLWADGNSDEEKGRRIFNYRCVDASLLVLGLWLWNKLQNLWVPSYFQLYLSLRLCKALAAGSQVTHRKVPLISLTVSRLQKIQTASHLGRHTERKCMFGCSSFIHLSLYLHT